MDTFKSDIGIIVGRFQVPELHEGHNELIKYVKANHDKVIIFLGCSHHFGTLNNPLNFECRQKMLNHSYPDILVLRIDDEPDDYSWSKTLDKLINKNIAPQQTVTLYGSRSSFISCYHGRHKTVELESKTLISGTEVRRRVINSNKSNADFRAGIIMGAAQRFPTSFQAVDIAIIKEEEVLLAQKPGEGLWRFVGGFSDPKSNSLEEDAKREVMEETGLEISKPKYLGSFKINDWRFRGEQDCIKSAFFIANYLFGSAKAQDDIASVGWRNIKNFPYETELVEEHRELWECLLNHLNKKETQNDDTFSQ